MQKKYTNQVRIIGGKWRGRKISFPDAKELRPTPDRIRETLFNWLSPHIVGAQCLDLFAGSGVLGFEALSRGAASCVLIEKEPEVAISLQKNAKILEGEGVTILQAEALLWLQKQSLESQSSKEPPFDIVFLDPPYALGLLPKCFLLLENRSFLKKISWIYFEDDTPINFLDLPKHWIIIKEKKAGNIYYYLAERNVNGSD